MSRKVRLLCGFFNPVVALYKFEKFGNISTKGSWLHAREKEVQEKEWL